MKAGLLYFLSVAGMFIISCNHKQSSPQTGSGNSYQNNGENIVNNHTNAKDSSLSSSWYVKGCAERAAKGDTKFPPSGDFPDLMYPPDNYIKSDGDSIVYNRYEEHLCCREVRVTTQRQGNIIDITEYWFRQGCKCKCSSMVHAVIYDLPKGEYQVYAIVTGTDPFDDKPANGRDTVMNKKVLIR
jgi:hypothetical protein